MNKIKNKMKVSEDIQRVLSIIKKKNTLNKSELLREAKPLTIVKLNEIIDFLEKNGFIMTAKVETFLGDKKVTQAFIIKYVKNKE